MRRTTGSDPATRRSACWDGPAANWNSSSRGVLVEELAERLLTLQDMCRKVGDAIARQFFHSTPPWVAWIDAGAVELDRVPVEGEL